MLRACLASIFFFPFKKYGCISSRTKPSNAFAHLGSWAVVSESVVVLADVTMGEERVGGVSGHAEACGGSSPWVTEPSVLTWAQCTSCLCLL